MLNTNVSRSLCFRGMSLNTQHDEKWMHSNTDLSRIARSCWKVAVMLNIACWKGVLFVMSCLIWQTLMLVF